VDCLGAGYSINGEDGTRTWSFASRQLIDLMSSDNAEGGISIPASALINNTY
jgi:hypothetical protein